ncbi:MAG TPA: hypothetical protein VNU72_10055 [Puia sp.]|nr:hypothetical protein [Puia sp.]
MKFSEKWHQVPRPVKLFLLRGAFLFVIWKLLYWSLLLPHRTLDAPLTRLIGAGTTVVLNGFSRPAMYWMEEGLDERPKGMDGILTTEKVERVYRGRDKLLSIADVCNGLELMVLYAGYILCWPGRRWRKVKFITGGWVLIIGMNMLRCAALALIYLRWPEYLDFYHHYLFNFIVYGSIFWLWYLFTPATPQKPALNVVVHA